MKFRQATYEEFKDLMRKAIMHEYEHYRQHVPTERREWMREYLKSPAGKKARQRYYQRHRQERARYAADYYKRRRGHAANMCES